MPTLQHPLPSFSLVLSQGRDSPALPDYYRTTRHEKYGPYLRSSTAAQDCMKTIDMRTQESCEFSSSFLLPDIFDENTVEMKSEGDVESNNEPNRGARRKLSAIFWAIVSLVTCGRKVNVEEKHELVVKGDFRN